MKILMLNPPVEHVMLEHHPDFSNKYVSPKKFYFYPPLGALYVLAYLEKHTSGHEIFFKDCAAEGISHRDLSSIVAEILSRYGMKPTTSSSASDAFFELSNEVEQGNPYLLTIIDAHMPATDGFELARKIKGNDRVRVPIIMMLTRIDATTHAAACAELEIREFIIKPVQESALIGAILKTVHDSSSRDIAGLKTTLSICIPPAEKALRILLAEDNLVNQKVAVRMLEKRGHSVSVASNGAEALTALGEEMFDLILMDVQMPGMDGITTTRIIRENEKTEGGHIPIVAMTAYAMKEDKERCLAAGMDAYLAKPVHPAEVFALVEELTAASQKNRVNLP